MIGATPPSSLVISLVSFGVFAAVLAVTAGLSQLTYRVIERPSIRLGGELARRWDAAVACSRRTRSRNIS